MRRIIVGVDGAAPSMAAAREAHDLATTGGGELHIVTALKNNKVQRYESGGDHWLLTDLEIAEEALREFAAELGDGPTVTVAARKGTAAHVILSEAERIGADLIVVGNRRMKGAVRVLGSVGGEIIAHAPCHVLVAKTH